MWPKIPHIVVLGAGYAGLPCALRLAKKAKAAKKPLFRVTLINPEGRQELTSDLYRSLRNGEPALLPFLGLSRNVGLDFIEAQATEINPAAKTLHYRGTQSGDLSYDYLIIATGLKRMVPEIEGLSEQIKKNDESLNQNIFFFRNNHQVSALRMSLNRLGYEEKTFRKNERDFFTVVLGAGSTGLEVAGELATLRGRNDKARVILLDQREKLLPDFSPVAQKMLKKELHKLQIESILGSPAMRMSDKEIFIENGQVVPWDLLVICTGSRLSQKLFAAFEPNPQLPGLETKTNFEIKNFPDHFAIGDVAHSHKAHHPLANKVFLPKTAQYAVQEGHFLAELLISHFEKGEPLNGKSFSPTELGYLVSLGPWKGLGRVGPGSNSRLKQYFTPFVSGPLVDELKRLATLKYRAQLEWDSRTPF